MHRRPKVTVTFAQSLDGRIATKDGNSQWISGPETLELAHQLRAEHDAVMVGVGTVLADDPQLTCRLVPGTSPMRVVLDGSLRTPATAKLLMTASEVPTVLFTSRRMRETETAPFESCGAAVRKVGESPDGRLNLSEVLSSLADDGIGSLLVEGGSAVITSFIAGGFWDRLVVVMAPMVIGTGTDSVGDLGITDLGKAPRARTTHLARRGEDIVWTLERRDDN